MNTTHQTYWQSNRILMGIFTLAIASVANLAFAQPLVQFGIGESARLLEGALQLGRGEITQSEFDSLEHTESWKDPATRLQNRNRPWMSVWNTTPLASPDDVTTVTIDLVESGFEFGNGDLAGDGFSGLLSMLSYRSDDGVTLDSATYGADNSELVLNFSGLSQGLAAIFRIDLDEPGGLMIFPDFREAMLGADTGTGPGQLATLTADFSSNASILSTFGRASPLSTSGVAEAYHGQTVSMVETSAVIPEPTSLLLLLAGLGGIAATRRYR